MTTGELIKKARKNSGLKQDELAQKLGIASATLAQWETGRRDPKPATIERIAAALGVPWTELDPRLHGLEQIDKYLLGHEASPEVYQKLEDNAQRHHGAQARATKALDQMTEEGRALVADIAEVILPRYQRPQALDAPLTTDPIQDAPEPQEAAEDVTKPRMLKVGIESEKTEPRFVNVIIKSEEEPKTRMVKIVKESEDDTPTG